MCHPITSGFFLELLSKAADAVSKFTTPNAIGRRGVIADHLKELWNKVQDFKKNFDGKMDGQKFASGKIFSGALDKLKALYSKMKANKAAFKDADDFGKAVDAVVGKPIKILHFYTWSS